MLKLADALADRAGAAEAYDAFHRELYDWLAGYAATTASSVERAEELGGLWDDIRTAARDTEEMNLDRRLHILATFARIAATDREPALASSVQRLVRPDRGTAGVPPLGGSRSLGCGQFPGCREKSRDFISPRPVFGKSVQKSPMI